VGGSVHTDTIAFKILSSTIEMGNVPFGNKLKAIRPVIGLRDFDLTNTSGRIHLAIDYHMFNLRMPSYGYKHTLTADSMIFENNIVVSPRMQRVTISGIYILGKGVK
jgi:hypothetical protein